MHGSSLNKTIFYLLILSCVPEKKIAHFEVNQFNLISNNSINRNYFFPNGTRTDFRISFSKYRPTILLQIQYYQTLFCLALKLEYCKITKIFSYYATSKALYRKAVKL